MSRFFPSPFGWPDRAAEPNRPPIADFTTGPHYGPTPAWRAAVKKPPSTRRRRAVRPDPLFDIAPPVMQPRPLQPGPSIHPMLRILDKDAARHMDHPLMGDLLSRDLPNPAPPYAPPDPASLTAETDPFLKLLQDRRAARASVRGRMLAWRAPGVGPAATPEGAPDPFAGPFADRPRFDRRAALTEAAKAAARAAKAGPDGMVPIAAAPAAVGSDRIDWTDFDRRARAFATEDLARDRDAFDAAWRREIRRPRISPVSPADQRARMDIEPDPNRLPKTEQDAWVAARAAELKRRRTLIQELLDAEAADDAREIDARAKGLRRRAETELSDIDWSEVARSGVERGTSDGPETDSPTPADGTAASATPPPLLDPATLTDAAQEEADSLGLAGEGHDTQPENQPNGVQVAVAPTRDSFGNPMNPGLPDPYQGLMIGGGAAAAGGAAASLPDSEGANSGGGPWDWLTDFFSSDKTDANAPAILPSEGDPDEGEDVYQPGRRPGTGGGADKTDTAPPGIGHNNPPEDERLNPEPGPGLPIVIPADISDEDQNVDPSPSAQSSPKSDEYDTMPSIASYPGGATPPRWTSTKQSSPEENLSEHWTRHRDEFPNLNSQEEYLEATSEFLNNLPETARFKKRRRNDDILIWDPTSNILVIMDKFGVPRSMYKPNPRKHNRPTNEDYWNDL